MSAFGCGSCTSHLSASCLEQACSTCAKLGRRMTSACRSFVAHGRTLCGGRRSFMPGSPLDATSAGGRIIAVAPWPLGYFDAVYGVTSLVLGAGMLALAVNVYRHRTGSRALRATRKLFAFSIIYLFVLFATLLLEVVVHAVAPSIW